MRYLFLIAVLLGCASQTFSKISSDDLRRIEGAWETASKTGIDGVFISFNSYLDDHSGHMSVKSQDISIRVYHRDHGLERQGYFSPGEYPGMSVSIDAQQLTIRFDGHTEVGPFDIDLRFDFDPQHWSGTWRDRGGSREVALERPRLSSGTQSSLVGNWIGAQNPQFATGGLYIRQSSDGHFIAWLDRSFSGSDPANELHSMDQRNGELLIVDLADDSKLRLKTTNTFGSAYVFNATVSKDGKSLMGSWKSAAVGGGTLNAPNRFTRSEESHR